MTAASPTVTVIIPAYREGATIAAVVKTVLALDRVQEVIVVDDGSDDATGEQAKLAGARVLRHAYNMGNGASIKTGIRNARSEWVVFMDADGQHDSADILRLLAEMDNYEMVIGARDFSGQTSVHRHLANFIYNSLATYVTRFPVKDLTSGFRCIKRRIALRYLYLLPNTFSYPSTLTLALLRSGHAIKYVPITVHRRQGAVSKIRIFDDGFRFLMIILKVTMLFSPLKVFLPASAFFAAASLANYAYTFWAYHRFTNMSAFLAVTSVLIFMMGLIAEQIAMLRMDRSEDE